MSEDCRECPYSTVLHLFVTAHWFCVIAQQSKRRIGNYPNEGEPITPPDWCPLRADPDAGKSNEEIAREVVR